MKELSATIQPKAVAAVGLDGPERLRRCLLGLITALLVARTLLPGEDPGRSLPTTGIAGLVLTFLWLLAGVGWAAWRSWSRQTGWRGAVIEIVPLTVLGLLYLGASLADTAATATLVAVLAAFLFVFFWAWYRQRIGWTMTVEGGLLAFVALLFLGAALTARYHHPAWLISWDWLALLMAFVLVRQLVRSEEENRALLAVLLATGVSLAAAALLQAAVPIGGTVAIDPTVAQIHGLEATIASRSASAPFADPRSLAVLLVLLAPALVLGWHQVGQAMPHARRLLILTGLCSGVVFLGLGLVHSWPAVLALVIVSAGCFLLVRGLPQLGLHRSLGAVGLAVGAILLPALLSKDFQEILTNWLDCATATWALVRDHLWTGVGAGNFSRSFPVYLESPAAERAAEPHNFLLETLAVGGMLALVALAYTLVAFFWRVWPELRGAWSAPIEAADSDAVSDQPQPPTRWEFYIGGIAGLTLVFLLLNGGSSDRHALLWRGALSAVRSLVWFAAFAILEAVPWTQRRRVLALAAGVAAALLCLLLSGGFFYPSLALPLWIMAALALNAAPATPEAANSGFLGRLLPAAGLSVACWVYLLVVLVPSANAARQVSRARLAYAGWRDRVEPEWRQGLDSATTARQQLKAANQAEAYLRSRIVEPLQDAVQSDTSDVGPRIELAYWCGQGWNLLAQLREIPNQTERDALLRRKQEYSAEAMSTHIDAVQTLDPDGRTGYWAAFQLRTLFAQEPRLTFRDQAQRYLLATSHASQLVRLDPSDARLRYLLAEAFFRVRTTETMTEGREQAERALNYDEQTGGRRLTDEQRQQAQEWMKAPRGGS